MRWRCLVIVVVAFIITNVSQIKAQSNRGYRFFVSGEYAFAISPAEFTNYYTSGIGFGVGIEYPVSPAWAWIGMFDLKFLGPDGAMIADWWDDPGEYPNSSNIVVSEGNLTAGTIAVLGKGCLKSPGARFFPYIKGGFGITIAGANEINVSFNNASGNSQTEWVAGAGSETNLSTILGFGVENMLGNGNSSLFFDVVLHMIMQDKTNPAVASIMVGYKF